MRTCLIHIGTHRTGTTAIQAALSGARRALLDRGYLYAAAGVPPQTPPAHHNLAWEIARDRRFRPEYGTIANLIAEITSAPAHGIVVSSEDFECALHDDAAFGAFIRQLQSAPLDVGLVVYLRDQVDYAVSLYLELLKHGLDHTFADFLDRILATGRYDWREWIFPFDYDELLARLEALGGVRLIVRPYDPGGGRSPVADFLSLLGLRAEDLDVDPNARFNPRPELVDAIGFFRASRMNAPPAPADLRTADAIGAAREHPPAMAKASALRIVERFGESNARVAARYGFDPSRSGASSARAELGGHVSMDEIFS